MPEHANDHTSKKTIRQTVEEGTRYLPDRVRDLPSIAVRTTVIGVGKLLNVTDRMRTEYDEARRNGVTPTLERLGRDGAHFLRDSLPILGSTHTQDRTDTAAESDTVTPPPTVAEPPPTPAQPPPPEATQPPRSPEPPERTEASPAQEDLPLSNYDELTVASLRARLRNLSISDLGTLLAYERSHQDRANVVTMFENRILKLEREGT